MRVNCVRYADIQPIEGAGRAGVADCHGTRRCDCKICMDSIVIAAATYKHFGPILLLDGAHKDVPGVGHVGAVGDGQLQVHPVAGLYCRYALECSPATPGNRWPNRYRSQELG